MSDLATYTVEQYLDARIELPDAGRWTELEQGQIINLDPPDMEHGTTLMNISKTVSRYMRERDQGSAYFDLGLVVKRDPDTVRFPAACIYKSGSRFEETDKVVTEYRPDVIFEVASTNARRRLVKSHVDEYIHWGVELIWVVDTVEKQVYEFSSASGSRTIEFDGILNGEDTLFKFLMPVQDLFAEPDWW